MLFLYLYMATVLVVLVFAAIIERHAIKERISGANGFIWTMLSFVMGVVLLPISLLSWIFGTLNIAFMTLIGGAIFLALTMMITLRLMDFAIPKKRN